MSPKMHFLEKRQKRARLSSNLPQAFWAMPQEQSLGPPGYYSAPCKEGKLRYGDIGRQGGSDFSSPPA